MNDFRNESMAYALAAGLVTLDNSAAVDRDAEKARRRARRERGIGRTH